MENLAGWRPDPTGRHEERFFRDSGVPTTRVRDGGIESVDGAPSPQPPQATSYGGPMHTGADTDPRDIGARPGDGQTGPTLIASYRTPRLDDAGAPGRVSAGGTATSRPSVVLVKERNWWLIASTGILAVLLVAVGALAFQQHQTANKWQHDYHALASKQQANSDKDVELYASLVALQQRFATCTNDTDRVFLDVEAYFSNRVMPPSAKADAETAGQACQPGSG